MKKLKLSAWNVGILCRKMYLKIEEGWVQTSAIKSNWYGRYYVTLTKS